MRAQTSQPSRRSPLTLRELEFSSAVGSSDLPVVSEYGTGWDIDDGELDEELERDIGDEDDDRYWDLSFLSADVSLTHLTAAQNIIAKALRLPPVFSLSSRAGPSSGPRSQSWSAFRDYVPEPIVQGTSRIRQPETCLAYGPNLARSEALTDQWQKTPVDRPGRVSAAEVLLGGFAERGGAADHAEVPILRIRDRIAASKVQR